MQPQASLFSMAFYSYVILLLTHIGIGAVAHGGGGQRRVWILNRGPKESWDSGPSLSQHRIRAWPREPSSVSFLPIGLCPTICNRGSGRGLLDPITPLTHHPSTGHPPPNGETGTRNGTMSPEEWLKELGVFSLGKMAGTKKETRSRVLCGWGSL